MHSFILCVLVCKRCANNMWSRQAEYASRSHPSHVLRLVAGGRLWKIPPQAWSIDNNMSSRESQIWAAWTWINWATDSKRLKKYLDSIAIWKINECHCIRSNNVAFIITKMTLSCCQHSFAALEIFKCDIWLSHAIQFSMA